jgi:hypothetical protein
VPSDAFAASEEKLAVAHRAMLHARGLQLGFKSVPGPPPAPGWLLKLLEALAGLGPVLQVVFWGGIAVGAALIVWFVVRELRGATARRAMATAAADWRPEPARARALLEEADGLAATGRFDEAIHLLLFRSIDDLASRRPGVVRPALTSRDISRLEDMPGPARDAFARIASRVETSFFGARPVRGEDFAAARGDYEAFAFSEGWS